MNITKEAADIMQMRVNALAKKKTIIVGGKLPKKKKMSLIEKMTPFVNSHSDSMSKINAALAKGKLVRKISNLNTGAETMFYQIGELSSITTAISVYYDSDGNVRLPIKPLSVNDAWKGRRFSTADKKEYERRVTRMLPDINIPSGPYEVYYKFGFSSAASDWDNPIKPLQDILAKKYKFNDKLIKRAIVETEKVEKGNEYIQFQIKTLK